MVTATRTAAASDYRRTNVVLDQGLLDRAKHLTGIQTTRGVLEESLRRLVEIEGQTRILDLFGKVEWEGDLDETRRGRFADADR